MAEKVLNRDTLDSFVARVERIESDQQRKWGEMSAAKMIRHLSTITEVGLEEHDVPDLSKPVVGTVLYYLFFRMFTNWPEGKIKAPDEVSYLFTEPDHDIAQEREHLIVKMRAFVDALEANPERKVLSPLLGKIPLRKWSYVHGAHNDHHLRQFGV